MQRTVEENAVAANHKLRPAVGTDVNDLAIQNGW